jgi:hypothetical protein
MSVLYGALRCVAIAVLAIGTVERVEAATFDLPLNGTVSIIGDLPASYNPSPFGPVGIEIQAIENFSLPVFSMQNPTTSVGVYQWSADFSVLNQSGSPIAEPDLSPLGTALTGYGQNCSVVPYCPNPSGDTSETILSGDLFISSDALTLQIATNVFTMNVPSYALELQVTLPEGLSITPVPPALPLFAAGLGVMGSLAWRSRRRPLGHATG